MLSSLSGGEVGAIDSRQGMELMWGLWPSILLFSCCDNPVGHMFKGGIVSVANSFFTSQPPPLDCELPEDAQDFTVAPPVLSRASFTSGGQQMFAE